MRGTERRCLAPLPMRVLQWEHTWTLARVEEIWRAPMRVSRFSDCQAVLQEWVSGSPSEIATSERSADWGPRVFPAPHGGEVDRHVLLATELVEDPHGRVEVVTGVRQGS